MPQYLHPDVLDNGIQHIINKATTSTVSLLLINGYIQGAAYAEVDGNKVMAIPIGAGDLSLGSQGLGRRLTVAEKSGTILVTAVNPDLHVALVDVAGGKVLAVTDETGDNDVTAGDPKTIPSFGINMPQPA